MPKIVVPLDFSPTSAIALNYGTFLSDLLGYDLETVHVHDGYSVEDTLLQVKRGAAASAEAKQKVEEFVRLHVPPTSFTGSRDGERLPLLQSRVPIGSPASVLADISTEDDVDLIVMGGVGTGAVSRTTPLFGSTARGVALSAKCPVLLLPPNPGPPQIERVALAFERIADMYAIYGRAERLLRSFRAQLLCVHIEEFGESTGKRKDLDKLRGNIRSRFPDIDPSLHVLPPGRLNERLAEFIEGQSVDLLVLGHHQRGFFERLFVASQTKPLLGMFSVPVLVTPIEE